MAKILIIESELADAQAAKENLIALGHEVELCGEPAAALSLAKSNKPDAIVLCVELEVGSGYSVCNKLRKDVVTAAIPLLLTSREATAETFEQHRRLKTHADLYLHKPYTQQDLLDRVDRLLTGPIDESKVEPSEVSLAMVGLDSERAAVDAEGDQQAMTVEVDLDALDVDQAFSEERRGSVAASSEEMPASVPSPETDAATRSYLEAENVVSDESEFESVEPLDLGVEIGALEREAQNDSVSFDVPDLSPEQPADSEEQDAKDVAKDEHAYLVGEEKEGETEASAHDESNESESFSEDDDVLARDSLDIRTQEGPNEPIDNDSAFQATDLVSDSRDDTPLLVELKQQLAEKENALHDMTRLRDQAVSKADDAYRKLEQCHNKLSQMLAALSLDISRDNLAKKVQD